MFLEAPVCQNLFCSGISPAFSHLILDKVSFSFILQIRKMRRSNSDASAWIQSRVQTDGAVGQTPGISNIHWVFERSATINNSFPGAREIWLWPALVIALDDRPAWQRQPVGQLFYLIWDSLQGSLA